MKTLITILFAMGIMILQAQNFEWADQFDGTGFEKSQSVAVDASGNIYTTGYFDGIADFDPGPGIYLLTSAGYSDVFVSKVNASGALVWVKQIGGIGNDNGNAITIDASGNVLFTGLFDDAVDFDPGPGSFLLTPIEGTIHNGIFYLNPEDLFICKFDASGNFVWAKQFGGSGEDYGSSIIADPAGNVITAGKYSNGYWGIDTADFDPGPGVFNLIGGGGFILQLDPAGNFGWAKQFGEVSGGFSACGGSGCIYIKNYSIKIRSMGRDDAGNLYTTGVLDYRGDFNPDGGTYILWPTGSRDMFVSKLNATGNFIWANTTGGSGAITEGNDIAIDASGNVVATGFFTGKVDFNPGSGTANITSNSPSGNTDVFVSKLNTTGNYIWAKQLGGNGDEKGLSISLDGQGNVYTTGSFAGKGDFDPSSGKYFLTASGIDIFISKLNASGNFSWARKIGSTGIDESFGITVDGSANVYTTGYFSGVVDFDPNGGVFNLTSAGGQDAFLLKMNQSSLEANLTLTQQHVFEPAIDKLSVYPNPNNGDFTISMALDDANTINGIIQITTQNGQLVKRINIEEKQSLDIHLEEPGLYFIQLIANNQMTTQKLSVVH